MMHMRLRASIVLAVIVGLLIPVTVSSLLTLGHREQTLQQDLTEDHRRFAEILALGMQEPLWNLSQDAGSPLFDSLLSDERVTALIVHDRKFGTFLKADFPQRRNGRQFRLSRDVLHGGNVIGSVTVEMDSAQLDAEIAQGRTVLIATVLGQLLLSLVLIVALLQRRLLRPIRRLMQESQQLARRELSQPFDWRSKDELGLLGNSLESTRQALQSLFDEIETKNRALEEDIARRMTIAKELQQHREHLEELVNARTMELTIAKERAEVASQAKSTFLASMTHELRTPLNAVLGHAQILKREGNLTQRQLASLETIRQSGEHLLTLITDLLDFSKIESGKFELYDTMVDLGAFLQVIVDIIRVRAEQKGLTFIYDTVSDLPQAVSFDDKRLRQVLLNLLGNAVKFTDHGQVGLQVRYRREDASHVRLFFKVRDTGVGMHKDQFERIFEPFEQVGEVKRRFGGTGLGLSISRQLVRMMGSDIHVSSHPGEGSEFRFDLRVAVHSAAAGGDVERSIIGYGGAVKRVLVVAALPASRAMLTDMLNAIGFDTVEVDNGDNGNNGDKAIAAALEQHPDLVMMELATPVQHSIDVVRRIRCTPGVQHLPIIAISASATPQEQARLTAEGVNAIIGKPFGYLELLRCIGELLKLDWIHAEAPIAPATIAAASQHTLLAPPEPEMEALYQLAMAGNMREIRRYAGHLTQLDERYRPFADKLHELANGYQSKAIVNLVEQHLAHPPHA